MGSKVAVLVGKDVAVATGNGVEVLVGAGAMVLVGVGNMVLVGNGVSEGAKPGPVVAEGIKGVGEMAGTGVFVPGSIVAVDGTPAVSIGDAASVCVADTSGSLLALEVPSTVEVGTEAGVGVVAAGLAESGAWKVTLRAS